MDDVWSTSYRVLENMSRSDGGERAADAADDGKDHAGDEEEDAEDDDDVKKPKRAGTRRGAAASSGAAASPTLESPTSSAITLSHVDAALDVDPLFHKMAAASDMGGAAGMLLHRLEPGARGPVVTFDSGGSGTVVEDGDGEAAVGAGYATAAADAASSTGASLSIMSASDSALLLSSLVAVPTGDAAPVQRLSSAAAAAAHVASVLAAPMFSRSLPQLYEALLKYATSAALPQPEAGTEAEHAAAAASALGVVATPLPPAAPLVAAAAASTHGSPSHATGAAAAAAVTHEVDDGDDDDGGADVGVGWADLEAVHTSVRLSMGTAGGDGAGSPGRFAALAAGAAAEGRIGRPAYALSALDVSAIDSALYVEVEDADASVLGPLAPGSAARHYSGAAYLAHGGSDDGANGADNVDGAGDDDGVLMSAVDPAMIAALAAIDEREDDAHGGGGGGAVSLGALAAAAAAGTALSTRRGGRRPNAEWKFAKAAADAAAAAEGRATAPASTTTKSVAARKRGAAATRAIDFLTAAGAPAADAFVRARRRLVAASGRSAAAAAALLPGIAAAVAPPPDLEQVTIGSLTRAAAAGPGAYLIPAALWRADAATLRSPEDAFAAVLTAGGAADGRRLIVTSGGAALAGDEAGISAMRGVAAPGSGARLRSGGAGDTTMAVTTPAAAAGGDDDGDDDGGGDVELLDAFGDEGGDFDGGAGTAAHAAQPIAGGVTSASSGGEPALVAGARAVERIRVRFETVAKKVDVAALKGDVWSALSAGTTPLPTVAHAAVEARHRAEAAASAAASGIASLDGGGLDAAVGVRGAAAASAAAARAAIATLENGASFVDTVRSLAPSLPAGVTVPFFFITVLHLANEHGLALTGGGGGAGLGDFKVARLA